MGVCLMGVYLTDMHLMAAGPPRHPPRARGHPKSHPNSLARDTLHVLRVADRNTSRRKRYHVVAAVELRGRCGLALCGAGTATRDFPLQLAYAESHLEMYVCTEA
jgi:hypothetical protein